MWRINPKQCQYDMLNPEGDIFSSAGAIGKFNIKIGDYICPVASGSGNCKLLGIWQVIEDQYYGALTEGQVCYIPPHDQKRKLSQHRVKAKLVHASSKENSAESLINKYQMIPSKLTMTVFYQLCALIEFTSIPKIKIAIKTI